ncbi:recombination-associated protein RdgC [Legionella sp. W05-934-2]|jgi:recombination associated protein RdgC|uniref:recombination-associated protein RdgC n=1 Tax=Legionella sp. W05-934-2 TaxID=1198649 RepID=UPI003461C028
MWFNQLMVFHYELAEEIDFAEALRNDYLKPCPPHARFMYGWLPAYSDELVQDVAGAKLICLGKEERILPRAVIQRELSEKIEQIEVQQNRQVKKQEKAQMMEDIEFDLLPKSFCLQKRLPAIIDTVSHRIYVASSSANQASQLLSLLRKSVPSISIEPFSPQVDMALRFASWISHPETLPANFSLANDCLLFSQSDEKKKINCKGYEMPADEILTLIEQGLAAAEISLTWHDRIQFTLTQDLIVKRLKCLDYLNDDFQEIKQLDEDYQQQDAALTLLSGELRGLVDDLAKSCVQSITLTSEQEPTVA